MSTNKNNHYTPPKAELFDVTVEGVVCASGIDSTRDGYDFIDDSTNNGWGIN